MKLSRWDVPAILNSAGWLILAAGLGIAAVLAGVAVVIQVQV